MARGDAGRLPARRPRPRRGRRARVVERAVASGETVYGVTTGFGALAERPDRPRRSRPQLQHGIVRSHATAVGRPLSREEARAMLLLRAHVLALGYSGVRPEVVDLMIEMLNRDVLPVVPEQGSLGASGDLAPLANLALPLIGQGEVSCRRRPQPAADALDARGPAAARAGGEGGPRARQRHAGDARDRDPRRRPRPAAGADRRRRRRHDDRGRARHRRALRRAAAAAPAAPRAGGQRREPADAAGRQRRSSPPTATARTWCRTRTRCGARRRSTARSATSHALRRAACWSIEANAVTRQPDRAARRRRGPRPAGTSTACRSRIALDALAAATVSLASISRTPALPPARPHDVTTGCRRSS